MIRTNDGKIIRGSAPDDIIAELNDMSFAPETSTRKFMTESAGRILSFFGRKIRTDSTENYVADLFAYGFLSTDEGPWKGDRC